MLITDAPSNFPLARHELFRTKNLDEARERVGKIFCPHYLNLRERGTQLDARQHSVSVSKEVSLNYVQNGAAVDIEPGYLGDFYLLQIPLRGHAQIQCGQQQIAAHSKMASLPSPTEPLTMAWAKDSPHLIVRLSKGAVVRQFEALNQDVLVRPLVFELGVDMESPNLAPMLDFVRYLYATYDRNRTTERSPLAEQAESFLISSLLSLVTHNYSTSLDRELDRALLPRSVKRAQEFLHAHAQEPLSLAEICAQLGIGSRTLQIAFKQHLGLGPMAYLRDIRLDAIRKILSDHDGVRQSSDQMRPKISELALKFNFLHLGHFAQHYQQRFGELPTDTMRYRRETRQRS
jgi:AraC-like DNA-binding protein